MLLRYNSFSDDILLESVINESIIYYSPDLRRVLNRMKDNSIAINLLEVEATDIKPDITFVDLDKEGYLAFSTMRNAKKLIVDKFPHLDYIDTKVDKDIADELFDLDKRGSAKATEVTTKSRNSVSIGKFVNKILPDKYSDKDREEFVNSFKASIEQGGEKFQLVEGEDIAFWYSSKNYKEKSGTLGNSCMAEKSGIFELYTQNPEVCRMLILTEDDKLIGRALVWKLQSIKHMRKDVEGVEYFMDRQYTIKDSDVQKLRNYAKEQGWIYKSFNNHHSFSTVTIGGEEKNVDMTVKLKKSNYSRFPYMDTFRRLDPLIYTLYNDDEQDSDYQGHYILEDTGGGYSEVESGVYSEWYDRTIPEDESVWSDAVDSYLYRDRAVEVYRGHRRNRGWWPEDHDNIVFDEWSDIYIHADDSVYSESYGYYILSDDAIEVVIDVDSDGSGEKDWHHQNDGDVIKKDKYEDQLWYQRMSSKYTEWDNSDGAISSLFKRDLNDNLILKVFEIRVYKVIGTSEDSELPADITGVEYLIMTDALVLGYDIDKDDYETTDKFQYQDSISSILPEVLKRVQSQKNKVQTWLSENRGDNSDLVLYNENLLKSLDEREDELENGTWD